ncbi:hypothetical protein [Neobacillus sp. NPDC093127]|uniref:hypothetical protein n=1 Tax=Neobacillus sp. NPDC093127 TaxID=3364296 RepID=UPI0038280C9F
MAKYKTLPNYELHRPEIHVQFNLEGAYETDNEGEITYLDGCHPFIERLDKPVEESKEEPEAIVKDIPKDKPKVKENPKDKETEK